MKGIYNKFWTLENVIVLRFLYPNTRNIEIAKLLELTEAAISQKAFKLKLKKDKNFIIQCSSKTAFKPGHSTFNKGKKQVEYMCQESINRTKETRFKPGNIPPQNKYDGALSKWSGYLYQRITKANWRLFHHLQYEKFIGEIPNNHVIIFKDGDSENCHPFNLACISRVENLELNTIQRFPPELVSTIKLLSKLKKSIKNGKEQTI